MYILFYDKHKHNVTQQMQHFWNKLYLKFTAELESHNISDTRKQEKQIY